MTNPLLDFCRAAQAGELEAARRTLSEHPDLIRDSVFCDDVPGEALTALALAAGVGSSELVRELLERGADAEDGAALFTALPQERWDCVDLLVEHGADPGALDPSGKATPLHWLLDRECASSAVEWLLARGVDPDLRAGPMGETALHVATRRRRKAWIEPLVRAGADVDAPTTGGMTAYRHALRRPFPEIVSALTRLGADTGTTAGDALATALLGEDLDRARELAPSAPKAREWVPEEARLLADLASQGKVGATALLLDLGADITARGLDNGTPLHQTAWFGEPGTARLLVERGAPLDLRGDDHDNTPLGWVAHGSVFSGGAKERAEAYAEVARILLEAGAPLPGSGDRHDRANLDGAAPAVAAVLARFGWSSGVAGD